ncbi:MAG: hypothetical protein LBC31_09680 [Treponema sp.]|jgi:hypothetical protein|nr:hypothetical protein [Treponema sp.]
MKKFFVILCCVLAGIPAFAERPLWADNPLDYAKPKYETGRGPSQWYYAVGVSNLTSSEQRARTRARENVQAEAAANVASEFLARSKITENSAFMDSDIEDVQRVIETLTTNTIKTKVPSFEILEWAVENGTNEKGQPWYRAYVLVRFPRKAIVEVVEKLEPVQLASALIRSAEKELGVSFSPGEQEELVEMVQEAKESVIEVIAEGGI